MIDWAAITPGFLDKFGETIYYLPDAHLTTTSGTGREIKAVVDRNPKATLAEAGEVMRDVLHVGVSNAAGGDDPGIASDEVNTGGDELLLAVREGETPTLVRINRIVRQDPGMMTVEAT